MKKNAVLIFVFIAAIVFMPSSIADEIDVFGDDLRMLEFREIPLGMHMPVVLLTEEARGAELVLLHYDSPDKIPEFGNAVYAIPGAEIFGQPTNVEYTFSYNRFEEAYAVVSFANLDRAQAYFDSALAALEEQYGAFDNMSAEKVFEGFELPEGEAPVKDSFLAYFMKCTPTELIDGHKYPSEYIEYRVSVALCEGEGGYEVRFGAGGGYRKTADCVGEIRYDGPWVN